MVRTLSSPHRKSGFTPRTRPLSKAAAGGTASDALPAAPNVRVQETNLATGAILPSKGLCRSV